MKTKKIVFIIFLTFFSFLGCQENTKHQQKFQDNSENNGLELKEKDYNFLLLYAYNYQPTQIDLSKNINDSLDNFAINYIYASAPKNSLLLISKLFLLKQYQYHLKKANQGYNLYTMRKGATKKIIDYYLKQNKIDTVGEFLNSGFIYDIEKNKIQNDTILKNLILEIKQESQRIMSIK